MTFSEFATWTVGILAICVVLYYWLWYFPRAWRSRSNEQINDLRLAMKALAQALNDDATGADLADYRSPVQPGEARVQSTQARPQNGTGPAA